jgi:hypothetical protein
LHALEGAQLTPIPFLLQAAHNSTHAAQAVQANPCGTVSAKGWRQGSRGAAGCRSECPQTVAAVCKYRTGNALQHTGIQLCARLTFSTSFLPCLKILSVWSWCCHSGTSQAEGVLASRVFVLAESACCCYSGLQCQYLSHPPEHHLAANLQCSCLVFLVYAGWVC